MNETQLSGLAAEIESIERELKDHQEQINTILHVLDGMLKLAQKEAQ